MGTVSEFFGAAEKNLTDAPVWSGELYLELHRGTCTSQAHNKFMNRRWELLLRDAEFLDAIVSVRAAGKLLIKDPALERTVRDVDAHGPDKENSWTAKSLDRAWKLVLLNQFHDLLPGSSIARVYADSRRDYQVIEKLDLAVRDAALEPPVPGTLQLPSAREPDTFTVFNTLAQPRRNVTTLPHGSHREVTVPSCGYSVMRVGDETSAADAVQLTVTKAGWLLRNGLLEVAVSSSGTLTSVTDFEITREFLSGRANELHLLRGYPNRWNFWDFEASAMEDFEVVGAVTAVMRILETGPLLAALEIVRISGQSTVTQRLVMRAGSRRVDFETTVDWQKRHRVLKVAFPLNIRTDHAVCEIQHSHVRRAVHRNTCWDAARFEMTVQQWIDLAENGCGVALLNNGIFGRDVENGRVRLTLLKAGCAPDPEADRGVHHHIFSLFPHSSTTQTGGVPEEAMALNVPLLVVPGVLPGPSSQSWLSFGHPGIRMEALKRAEDGQGLVLRLNENHGGSVTATLQYGLSGLEFTETNLR